METSCDLLRLTLDQLLNIIEGNSNIKLSEISQKLASVESELQSLLRSDCKSSSQVKMKSTELQDLIKACIFLLTHESKLNHLSATLQENLRAEEKMALKFNIITQKMIQENSSSLFKKKRLARQKITALEQWYGKHSSKPYLSDSTLRNLSSSTGLSRGQIRNWISNRRRKERNIAVSPEVDLLLHEQNGQR